jgi:nucleotide-binding universal stress UspA family protein
MIRLEKVLVPTDFSDTANWALKYGIELARANGATLHVLHVVTEPRHEAWMGYTPAWDYMNEIDRFKTDAVAQMQEDLAAQHAGTLPVVVDAAHGDAAEEILRYASEHGVGLIVCGTHGRRGWNRLVMGSIAEVVVRKAPCPVLTVQHPEREFVFADPEPPSGQQLSA